MVSPYPKGFVCLAAPFRRVGCVVFLVPREFRPVYAAAAGSISLITFDIRHFPDEVHLWPHSGQIIATGIPPERFPGKDHSKVLF